MKRDFVHLDVFADRAFHGNQLAVFTDATGLDAERMQRMANEMAFAESTFVFRPDSAETDARVRIFTPGRELPMAGHPTIGTAFALASNGFIKRDASQVTFALGVGPTPVSLEWANDRLAFAWMRQPLPTFGFEATHIGKLAAALGLEERNITATHLPAQSVSCGVPFLFVPVDTREAVNRVRADRKALQAFFTANGEDELPVFVFSTERGNDEATAFSRMFAEIFGVPEDPATGGASGPLGAYLLHHGVVSKKQAERLWSYQGVAMGRPSRIAISVQAKRGKVTDVRVGGSCVSLGAGYLDVPEQSAHGSSAIDMAWNNC
jgi:trans-2,3-dihydro-3-hydroxyanthranilate isomerase